MIAISRKSLSSLSLNPNSFLCNSILHFIPSIHFSSTSKIKRLLHCPEIYDVLVNKHEFSSELASTLAASLLPKPRSPKRADSVLSYLKENSFTTAQLQKIMICNPGILGLSLESVESRLKLFRDLGLSSEEIAKMFSSTQLIFRYSVANKIVPALSVLKGLLGSNEEVARLLKRCAWFVTADLKKILMPNVEILKNRGMPTGLILHSLYVNPRCFLIKPEIMRKSVDKAIEIGVPPNSSQFVRATNVFASTSERMWEVKLQILRDLGFSDDDMFTIFRQQPSVFSASGKKMKDKIELLLASGKYNISSIVAFPAALTYSIEKRIEPRMQIMRLLESRNLIQKWPPLSTLLNRTDDKFIERYIRPYYDEIGEEQITQIYIPKGQGDDA